MMRKSLFAVAVFAAASVFAVEWRNLDDAHWVSGPKCTAATLEGKVVFVDEWGVNCPPCRALLPRIEQIWQSFKGRGLVVIGSHRQGDVKARILELRAENKLSYPIYVSAGIEGEPPNGGGIPFMYVLNTRGEVVYSGRDERAATAAIVNAITEVADPNSLIGSLQLVKFKAMAKDLVLGKNVESKMTNLKLAAKKTTPEGKEAADIVAAVEKTKAAVEKRIRANTGTRPGAALTDIVLYGRTWPSAAAEFAEDRKKLEAIPDVRKLQQAVASLDKVNAKPPKNSGQARGALAQLASVAKTLDALAASDNEAVKSEAGFILEKVRSAEAEYGQLMPKKK